MLICPACGQNTLEIEQDEAMGQTINCPHCGYREEKPFDGRERWEDGHILQTKKPQEW